MIGEYAVRISARFIISATDTRPWRTISVVIGSASTLGVVPPRPARATGFPGAMAGLPADAHAAALGRRCPAGIGIRRGGVRRDDGGSGDDGAIGDRCPVEQVE